MKWLRCFCGTLGLVAGASGLTAVAATSPSPAAAASSTWTPTAAPTSGLSPTARTNPRVMILASACPAAGSCVAVGFYFDSSDNQQGLIETLSGGIWTAMTAPLGTLSPAAGTDPEAILDALSCPAAGSCVVVGYYKDSSGNDQGLIETLSAASWTAMTAPLSMLSPAAGTDPEMVLDALSCPAAGSCVAVGYYNDSSNQQYGLIETLSAGTWTPTTAPTSGLSPTARTDPEMVLDALSCPAAGSCVAVGNYDDTSSYVQGLIETLSGGIWTPTTAPTSTLSPAAFINPVAYLDALSCPAAGSCVAVGTYTDSSSNHQALIEILSGGTWTAITAPTSGLSPTAGTDPQASLHDVSCPAAGSCTVVGGYQDSSGSYQGLIETLSAGTWTPTAAPTSGLSPAAGSDPAAYVEVLSCPAAGSCVAVGSYEDSDGNEQGLIETLSGGTWTATTTPTSGLNPAAGTVATDTDPEVNFQVLSCPAAGSCVAVGSYEDSDGNQQGLIETLSGGTWTAITAPTSGLSPVAGGNPEVSLAALSCPAAGSCVAVGNYADLSGNQQGLIETLSAENWVAITAPLSTLSPAAGSNPEVELAALSCPAAGSCVAVGDYTDLSGNRQGLIETLSGGNWVATTAPLSTLSPAAGSNPEAYLAALSCPAAGSCVAVGIYYGSSDNQEGLIETLSGGNWVATTAPLSTLSPAAGTSPVEVYPEALSCPAIGSCVAVGYYTDSSGGWQGLIETLSAGNWVATTAPTGSGLSPVAAAEPGVYLDALSCPAAGSCVAVGTYVDSSNYGQGLIETLSGGSWTASTVPTGSLSPTARANPQVYLNDVSCPATGSCVAVGYYTDSSNYGQRLIGTLSAGTWTASTVPIGTLSPAAGSDPEVDFNSNSLACPAVGSCVAVGYYTDSSGNQQGLIETLSGGTWTASTVPIGTLSPTAGSDPEVNFNSLACPAVGSCVAVGYYTDSSGNQQGLIETQSSSTSNPCAAYTGNDAFICSAYEDLVGRAPDSAGLTYWNAQLANGTSRSVVAYDVATSTEYRTDLVKSYYEYYLGRAADLGGLAYWVTQLNSGSTDESVIAAILGSDEFYTTDSGGTADGFVTALYGALLGRTPDSGGLAYWESQLSSGMSRSAVAGALLSSTEYATDLVNGYYAHFLGRTPDLGGLRYWVAQLVAGVSNESVISAIVGSPEFYTDATS
jgi:hypothetical protein